MARLVGLLLVAALAGGCDVFVPDLGDEGQKCAKGACQGDLVCCFDRCQESQARRECQGRRYMQIDACGSPGDQLDTCLDCETCTDELGCTRPRTQRTVCVQDGESGLWNVHWVDACGEPEDIAAACPAMRGACEQVDNDTAQCACEGNHWDIGADCQSCEGNWDQAQDCQACLGNWDAEQDCGACLNHWVDTGDDCGTCPTNWDPGADCDACLGNWDPDQDCAVCRPHWTDVEDDDCSTCPGNWDPDQDCSVCRNRYTDQGNDCGTCPAPWDSGLDCLVCTSIWDADTDCASAYCLNHDCRQVPATGQQACYDNNGPIECPGVAGTPDCASTTYCGQDFQYSGGGDRSFLVSNVSGFDLAFDPRSGLMWQVETEGNDWNQAPVICAGQSDGGFDDWRVPAFHELLSLADYGRFDPAWDTSVFPDTGNQFYWSATHDANPDNPFGAWHAYFYSGQMQTGLAAGGAMIRCVRGGLPAAEPSYTVQGTIGQETVTDDASGLTWTKTATGHKTWQEALAYCEQLSYAEADDWRLPNINEARSLINPQLYNPTSSFPDLQSMQDPQNEAFMIWSSTTKTHDTTKAWTVDLTAGWVGERFPGIPETKINSAFRVMCVRGP